MKKFYYKKAPENIDSTKPTSQLTTNDFEKRRTELLKSLNLKTPIILQLDRRRSLNASNDTEVSRFRATSISSADQFRDIPKIPRVRTRKITKSFSEDFLANSIYSPSPSSVVITESELSSSWLYNNMKDGDFNGGSGNAIPLKSRYRSEPSLSPVMLRDPKMKPVLVKTKPRPEKSSSRFCYLAIVVIICLCTLGFMSTIGGIIYLEVYSNKSVESSAETLTDALDVVYETKPKINEERAGINLDQRNFDTKDNQPKMRNLHDNDLPKKTVRILDFEKKPDTDLTQFIDNTRTEIRTHKDNSVVFEEKESQEVKFEDISVTDSQLNENTENIQIKDEDALSETTKKSKSNLDKLERVSTARLNVSNDVISKDEHNNQIGPVHYHKNSRKLEAKETKVIAESMAGKDSKENTDESSRYIKPVTEDNQATNHSIDVHGEKANDNLEPSKHFDIEESIEILPIISNVFQEVEIPISINEDDEKAVLEQHSFLTPEKTNQENENDETLQADEAGETLQADEAGETLQADEAGETLRKDEAGETLRKDEAGETLRKDEAGETLRKDEAGETLRKDETGKTLRKDELYEKNSQENYPEGNSSQVSDPDQKNFQENGSDESDRNFESMVTAINEHIKNLEKQEHMFPESNGNVNIQVLENSNSITNEQVISDDEVKVPISDLPQEESSENFAKSKPRVDIRVSLAEAMKHLQVLDTQNKILSSRIKKSSKPKIKINRPRLQTIVKQPDKLKANEQKNYLNNIRFMLMDRLRNEM